MDAVEASRAACTSRSRSGGSGPHAADAAGPTSSTDNPRSANKRHAARDPRSANKRYAARDPRRADKRYAARDARGSRDARATDTAGPPARAYGVSAFACGGAGGARLAVF